MVMVATESDKLALAADQNIDEGNYWMAKLSGKPEKTRFPYDFQKEHPGEISFQKMTFRFPTELYQKAAKLSGGVPVKLHMILVTGLVLLLSKYTGNEDILVGSPILKQDIEGSFINTLLVFRNRVQGTASFKELLLEIRKTIVEANENQNYPFRLLPERLGMPMQASEFPFSDVFLLLEGLHDREYIPDDCFSVLFAFRHVNGDNGHIEGFVEYDALLYDKRTIHRWTDHYMNVLSGALIDVNLPVSKAMVISESEREELLTAFNNTDSPYDTEKSIVHLFDEQTARTPGNTAVTGNLSATGRKSLTFSELNRASEALARFLKQKGVGPDTIIAVLVEPSVEMIISLLAILKAGGAYLPIEPEYPEERIQYIMEDSGAKLLLTHSVLPEKIRLIEDLHIPGVLMLLVDQLMVQLPSDTASERLPLPEPDHAVYVIYTSGTTGRPKGVLVDHGNVAAYLHAFYHQFDIRSDDVVIQLAAYSFDVFTEEVYPVLLRGGQVVIPNPADMMDMQALTRLIEEHGVTVIDCTPLLLSEFNKIAALKGEAGPLRSVRIFISGGDVLNPGYVDHLIKTGSVYNTYGPTESTVCVTHYLYQPVKEGEPLRISIPIGKPVANYRAYIRDQSKEIVPIGVTGELYASGPGIARGYLNRPELTAKYFVFNESYRSYPSHLSHRSYRTGDRARWLTDGNIEFLGRIDNQVKIRGYRIETGEIENRLMEHPAVTEAVVAVKDGDSDKYLCAYLVATGDEDVPEATELREYLSHRIPAYMVPSFYTFMDKLPVTHTGKVDRGELPAPEIGSGVRYVEPRSIEERRMQQIWQEALGVEKVGIIDNFFDIGGHSLKGIQVINDIHREFNVKIPLAEMFKTPTIEELCKFIAGAVQETFQALEFAEKKEYYPLSPAQERLYVLQRFIPESAAYNLPQVIPLQNADSHRLQETFNTLLQRHESLRTSFCIKNGVPVQRIHDEVSLEITKIPGPGAGEGNPGKEWWADVGNRFTRPFDLSRAPLLRVGIAETDFGVLLVIDMHHIITDAVSQGILVREFIALYDGDSLPPLDYQYKDYSEWIRGAERQEGLKEQEDFWLQQFSGEVPVLDIPVDFPRPRVQSFEGAVIGFGIPLEHMERIKEMAVEAEVTHFILLLALFNVLLAKITNMEDIVTGTPIAARRHADIQGIVGMFVNTLALRNGVDADVSFENLLHTVKQNTLEAFENQEYPFESLVDQLDINRDTGRNPLFDVMFNCLNQEEYTGQIPEMEPGETVHWAGVAKFDLTFTAVEMGSEGFMLFMEYCSLLFKPETVVRFIEYFRRLIAGVTKKPGIRLREIDLLTDDEKYRLITELNQTDADFPADKTIQQLFMEQAVRTPDHIAVKGEQLGAMSSLTYAETVEASLKLAEVLHEKGIGPDNIIAVMLERGIDMVTSILGILMAGGAYLPIDPTVPADRVRFMLKDSGAEMLITRKNFGADMGTNDTPGENNLSGLDVVSVVYVDDPGLNALARSFNWGSDDYVHGEPENLAYVIYTSGTTGRPKGVLIEQRNVVRLFFNDKFQFDFDDRDVWSLFHSFGFDFSVWEMYGALLYGGCVVVIPRMDTRDPKRFWQLIMEHGVTVLNQTPSAFYSLSDAVFSQETGVEKRDGTDRTDETALRLRLRYVIFGGEALKPAQLKRWRKRFPHIRLINMFGITETCVHVTYKEIGEVEISGGGSNIGNPIPTLTAYVLDAHGQLLPLGTAGELWVGGAGVARGYLNRPELTVEKFPVNRFARTNIDERVYRTGDLVRYSSAGELEYLGRIDHQVQLRGFRIELGEIENRLAAHDMISEAVVTVAHKHSGNGDGPSSGDQNFLCAYFTGIANVKDPGNNEADVQPSALRSYLARYLPEYMIPAYFERVERIPVTANGKVDRKRLPKPSFTTTTKFAAPKAGKEKAIAEVWAGVLGIDGEALGVETNFFELGGNSLSMVKIAAQLKEVLNIDIPIVEMFRFPTVRELAAFLDEDRTNRIADRKQEKKIGQDRLEKMRGRRKR